MRTSHTLGTKAAEPPSEATVKKTPLGVAVPTGGWSVVFADAFGAPLGTAGGQDNFWYPNKSVSVAANTYQAGHNQGELQVFHSSAVRQTAAGLLLDCTYSPNAGGTGKNYIGGEATTVWRPESEGGPGKPAGYNLFRWKPCQGGVIAFEVVMKLPTNTGEMDPSFWSYDQPWTNEIDFPEFWGWPSNVGAPNYFGGFPTWKYKKSEPVHSEVVERYNMLKDFGFEPSSAYHRYCTVLNENNSIDFYIDGVKKWSLPAISSSEITQVWMGLVCECALRRHSEGGPETESANFKSGTRTLGVRSAAVYRDTPHVAVGVEGGGIATGTSLV